MNLIPWRDRNPMNVMTADLDSWLEDGFKHRWSMLPEAFRRTPMPPVNLAETPKEFIASIELPGLDEKEIQVQVLGDQLVISGERKWDDTKQEKEYYRVESQYGAFRRVIDLPEGLDRAPEAIRASYGKGVLEVRLAKLEPKPAARVKVVSAK